VLTFHSAIGIREGAKPYLTVQATSYAEEFSVPLRGAVGFMSNCLQIR
jgi:hypothetical protein